MQLGRWAPGVVVEKRNGIETGGVQGKRFNLVRGDSFEFDSRLVVNSTAVLKPGSKILALTDIESLELVAALRNGLNTNSSHSNTPTDR
jgi:hypothetical protein